ncbi:MAG: pilin [Parcubacteria group bacterium]|nr:pilin [Parcubacteria group bacterium]MCR4342729.1 pilin [Patescibacteria group bacterium]
MMKKILKIKGLAVIALGVILMSPVSAFAYELLEPLPGLNETDVTLSSYLSWLFPFALTVTAVLAVVMIVIGGLQLAGGGSEGLKTAGKKRIESAIYGLLLAVSAYLILYTINPNLVNMSLGIDPITKKEDPVDISAPIIPPASGYYFSYQSSNGSRAIGPYDDMDKCKSASDAIKAGDSYNITMDCYFHELNLKK